MSGSPDAEPDPSRWRTEVAYLLTSDYAACLLRWDRRRAVIPPLIRIVCAVIH